MSTHLTLDPIACDGHGICAELLPEHITLDDWGFPMINPTAIPEHLLADARRAVKHCPALALHLRQVSARPNDAHD
ncbi:MAG TPA: ferredoxin [Acidimicrobiales bacterium]|nr:ferredoxin [Acidimicrobiales bacterium]